MRPLRLVVNLAVFTLIALGLVAYGVVDLLGNPFATSTSIAAVFPDASGIDPNFSVELNGVTVGSVSAVHLVRGGAEVDMTIDPGVEVPGDVVATIGIANDLGEQVVALTPRHGGHVAPLASGAIVPVSRDDAPVQVGTVVALATRLLRAIPANKVNELLSELAQGLHGQARDIRTIIGATTTFSRQFLRYQAQFEALLRNAPPVMDAVSAGGPQLTQALANTEAILKVLADEKTSLKGDLVNGQAAAGVLGQLTRNQAPDVACLVHDFSRLNSNLDQPQNLSNLSSSLALNRYFFHAVTAVAVRGLAKSLTSRAPANPGQTMLRTRLVLPPEIQMGDTYATPVPVPAVKPGAGCSTELGQGVGPARQSGFSPAAGGTFVAPTSAESRVRGRGDVAGSSTTAAPAQPAGYDARAAPRGLLLALAVGICLPGLAIAWSGRPRRRRRAPGA